MADLNDLTPYHCNIIDWDLLTGRLCNIRHDLRPLENFYNQKIGLYYWNMLYALNCKVD